MYQHFAAHFIFGNFSGGRGRAFCKLFASRGTIFRRGTFFHEKKSVDLVFFAVILRAFFVEHFAQRGTFWRANLVFFVKIFYYFLIVFFRWAWFIFPDEKNTSLACFRRGRENLKRIFAELFDGYFIFSSC